MNDLKCPLCGQNVTQALYDKIMGTWDEKEKLMSSLKAKEKALLLKEKKQKEAFELEKKNIVKKEQAKFEKEFIKQQKLIKKARSDNAKEKAKLEAVFKSKMDIILRDEKKKQKEMQSQFNKAAKENQKILEEKLKIQFDKDASSKIKKAIDKTQREKRLQDNRINQLNIQFTSLQKKSLKDNLQANAKIKSLEEQLSKKETPSVLGLLEEKVFLKKLETEFPEDKFDHTGKGGDILEHIYSNGKEIGIICFELKKVSLFQKSHVEQAYQAKQIRKADYGILVTNAKRKTDESGFFIEKGIIVIHPTAALVLVSLLRNHAIEISKLKLSSEKRSEAINNVLNYIQSPVFRNGIENIITDSTELYDILKKEVKSHTTIWEARFNKYKNIYQQAVSIETKAIAGNNSDQKQIDNTGIIAIDLPSTIGRK